MEKYTKYKPEKQFTIANDGFHGSWYKPEKDCFPGKVMVVFGGSAGSFRLTQTCAERFCSAGMNALATAYRDVPGAPSCLYGVPVELIENAAKWCKENIADKVGVWGISLGGQLAFLAGSLCNELISCVVAVNPMHFSMQGVASFRTLEPVDRACFTFRGKDLDYFPFGLDKKGLNKRIREDSHIHHEYKYIRDYYEELIGNMSRDADYMISVENTKGAVLMISAGQDTMLPSKQICEAVYKRLEEKGFAYPFVHKNYEVASHFLFPVKLFSAKIFRAERKNPKQCDESRKAAWEDTLTFLKEVWI